MKKVLYIALVVGFMSSCNSTQEEKKNEAVTISKDTAVAVIEEEHHHDDNDSIVLNNGAKWKVVEKMMAYIKTMENDIKQFTVSKTKKKIADYTKLGSKLQTSIDSLTSNCTMTGKGHDELHKWLLPFIDNVETLGKSTNVEEAKSVLNKLDSSYILVNTYFE